MTAIARQVLAVCLILLLLGYRQTQETRTITPSFPPPANYAIYYGQLPVYRNLDRYDWVIVSDGFLPERSSKTRYFAYLTIGEIDKGGSISRKLEKALGEKGFQSVLLKKNPHWDSWVADLRNPAFRAILLDRVERDKKKGFRGIFLDTLDSSLDFEETYPVEGKGLRAALVSFIQDLHQRYPTTPVIVNRGFPILSRIANSISGVLFEDFCSMYDDHRHLYVSVPEQDRKRELSFIHAAQTINPGLTVLALDYGSAKDTDTRFRCAKMAHRQHLVPFFSNRNLDEIP
ncbi:MAG: endo alpha-1,4 polygalactosaminidase [Leptospirales bacterium]